MDSSGKQKVLLLRSEASGPDKYARVLEENECDVYNVPTLDFIYQNLESLGEKLNNPALFSGIVFTSPRAVIAAGNAKGERLSSAWTKKPCFVVGERTGGLVADKLGLTHIGSESGDASSLADLIVTTMPDRNLPLLFPCGNLKKETLPKKLKDAGIQLDSCTVYTTRQHPSLIPKLKECLELKPEFVIYFSPSGVNFSQEIIKQAHCLDKMKHVSIGPATRAALEENGIKVFASAANPCPEAVLEIVRGAVE